MALLIVAVCWSAVCDCHARIDKERGEGAVGPDPLKKITKIVTPGTPPLASANKPTSLANSLFVPYFLRRNKYIGFLSNTGPDPLENHTANTPAFIGLPAKRPLNGISFAGR